MASGAESLSELLIRAGAGVDAIEGGAGYDALAADMWSVGICMFAMLSMFFPWIMARPNLALAYRAFT